MGSVDANLADVLFTSLRRIATPGGDVFHGMKSSDPGFSGFGEAYFSTVDPGYVKGWKKHIRMTLNLVVPAGKVQIAVVKDKGENLQNFLLGPDEAATYGRLTVPPGYWVAFGGAHERTSVMLNLASIPHDPNESETCSLATFPWAWVDKN